MKKRFLAVGLLACVLLSGCVFGQEKPITEPPQQSPEVINTEKETKKISTSSAPKDVGKWEPMGRYSFDITGDGEDDIITLYASVMRDEKGELMWDDTQEWVLQAETAEGVYDLYDERLHGNAYLSVAEFYNEDADKKVVTLIVTGNSLNEVREYRFGDNVFEETIAYTTDDNASEGINALYSSIPAYE